MTQNVACSLLVELNMADYNPFQDPHNGELLKDLLRIVLAGCSDLLYRLTVEAYSGRHGHLKKGFLVDNLPEGVHSRHVIELIIDGHSKCDTGTGDLFAALEYSMRHKRLSKSA